ncbi:hypothetical protein OUZ56_026284 [Daphnia magna]|uniref:Uncharacterized protein n=1 Tax=Daphnia magna TaxID=35525 RepID=A0ABQ9ZL99_9CRUS|nr:hypothetical protein OUZ56_026284 [Daphnia magna]
MDTLLLLAENLRNARRSYSFSSVGSVAGDSSTVSIAGGSTVGSKAEPSVDGGCMEVVGSACLRFLRNIGRLIGGGAATFPNGGEDSRWPLTQACQTDLVCWRPLMIQKRSLRSDRMVLTTACFSETVGVG